MELAAIPRCRALLFQAARALERSKTLAQYRVRIIGEAIEWLPARDGFWHQVDPRWQSVVRTVIQIKPAAALGSGGIRAMIRRGSAGELCGRCFARRGGRCGGSGFARSATAGHQQDGAAANGSALEPFLHIFSRTQRRVCTLSDACTGANAVSSRTYTFINLRSLPTLIRIPKAAISDTMEVPPYDTSGSGTPTTGRMPDTMPILTKA